MSALPAVNINASAIYSDTASVNAAEMAKVPRSTKLLDYILEHVTFYRIHLAAFTIIPLITSGIFYASNGRFPVKYIDCLFLCYSAMTVTGLSTVNLSTLTVWQQIILYLLMLIGDITTVSWVMVLIRKRFFRTHCEYTEAIHKHRRDKIKEGPRRSRSMFLKSISSPIAPFKQRQPAPQNLRTKTNPSDTKYKTDINVIVPTPANTIYRSNLPRPLPSAIPEGPDEEEANQPISDARTFSSSPAAASVALPDIPEAQDYGMASPATDYGMTSASDYGVTSMSPRTVHYQSPMMEVVDGRARPRRGTTMLTNRNRNPTSPNSTKEKGNGGFPGPVNLINRLAQRAAPRVYRKLERKLTIASYQTVDENKTSWLNFSGLIVGRNSDFRTETLSDDQVEQLGGAEYRALRMLSYLVPAYFVCTQLFCFTLFAPWISTTSQYDSVFEAQPRLVDKTWFALFQVMGAYTGGGMSLVDMGMLPFQTSYLMIFGMMISILAGNHALPILMRSLIWVLSKFTQSGSGFDQAFTFLLDHPRRCYLYLFPSHQTWFLLICLVLFSIVEWGSFLVLDIGIPAYEDIPPGVRTLAGLFQGLAARASGFAIVPLASFAPALLQVSWFLYVVMMYIAIYPVALSIRSTNVYEERSLGVFEEIPDEEEEDEELEELPKISSRSERIGRYVHWHLRRQLSIDIWWLVWGVFLITVIERGNLMDQDKKWFDLFRVIFEMVSAFGGIGLSLGVPYDNFSFAGVFRPLSKLVVIVIMIRGRHRGLPVAVDRAVQLPREMVTAKQSMQFNEKQSQPQSPPEPQTTSPVIRVV